MSEGRLVILGAGESGTGAALLGKAKGWDVFVSDAGAIKPKYVQDLDSAGIIWEQGTHSSEQIMSADLVVKSPGIPPTAPIVQQITDLKTDVIDEIEFALRYTKATVIGITGTNGKTTTTLLSHHILSQAGLDVCMAGNVGTSLARQLTLRDYEYIVLELSSFQLDGMSKSKMDIAILLNITPDHLDRYENMEAYTASKFRISNNQTSTDHFIYCTDDQLIAEEIENLKPTANLHPISIEKEVANGAFLSDQSININIPNLSFTMSIHELALQGRHNTYNSMAGGVLARLLEIRKESIRESLSDFTNAEHRLESVGKVHGIEFINDSKATNINSTWYALESTNGPVVWIVGGVDKGNDYNMVMEMVKEKVKAIICLGKDNSKIIKAFSGVVDTITEVDSAQDAVNTAYYLGKQGDSVLLSPACASFDLFESYEDRGQQFKAAVRSL
ncbi:MAG: UDP-N-acetylmuramoylalanine--D-glutamate ligase [Granulosicoccus sp.]|jgi:UDP-N-acetylmuramoylalanine--D-glutamate ligase